MKCIAICLGLALALAGGAPAARSTPAADVDASAVPEELRQVRDDILERMKRDPSIPSIAVAVARDGRILWEEGFGWADRERGLLSTPHTPYSLASISKPITTTGLMVLVEAGKVDLEAPANDYLGPAKLVARVGDARQATVRRVADHTAGLPLYYQFFYEDEPWRRPPMEETLRRYGDLVTPPGEFHEYSNLGYGVLDYLIERVSGQRYADFMRERVFEPLGLDRTSVDIAPRLQPLAAARYGEDGKPLPFYGFDHPGASAVYSSAHDLVRFAMFHLKDRLPEQRPILSDAQIEEMHAPTASNRVQSAEADLFDDGDGIGFVVDRKHGHRFVWHDGGMGGVSTMMKLLPDRDIAIVVLSNSRNGAPTEIADRILRALVPDYPPEAPRTPQPEFSVPPALLGRWDGHISTYAGEIPVSLEFLADDRILAQIGMQSAPVAYPSFKDGHFTGQAAAQFETPDNARFPGATRLALNLRGDVLNGSATGVHSRRAAPDDLRTRNALSHWIELKRRR